MKKIYLILALVLSSTLFFTNCGSENKEQENKDSVVVEKKLNSELLLEEIVKNGDLINSDKVPTLIPASEVNAAAEGAFQIIDLRTAKDYADGHIKNAMNIKQNELIDYMKTIDVANYEKIVLVCYTGQIASYSASVLQMMGYTTVYAMKWGMVSWNAKFSEKWISSIGNSLADKLSTEAASKGEKTTLPNFETQKTKSNEILTERASFILNEGFTKGSISLDEVLAAPNDFYLVNYWPAKAFNIGHLAGAVQYTPKESLSTAADLLSLPTNKTIVVYCFTGQHSAFVAAYLRMLGYDAKSLKYGANGFMNKMMQENPDLGHAFTKKEINNFKFETSKYVDEGEPVQGGC